MQCYAMMMTTDIDDDMDGNMTMTTDVDDVMDRNMTINDNRC